MTHNATSVQPAGSCVLGKGHTTDQDNRFVCIVTDDWIVWSTSLEAAKQIAESKKAKFLPNK